MNVKTALHVKGDGAVEYDHPPEYTTALATALLDVIDPTPLDDTGWLSVISSAKMCGVSDADVDAWNSRDTTVGEDGKPRYNQRENNQRLQSLNDPRFGIGNLIGKAPASFDYSEFARQWYKEHPEYRKAYRKPADVVPATSPFFISPEIWKNIQFMEMTNGDDAERLKIAFGKNIRWNTDSSFWGLYTDGTWNFCNSSDAALYPYARSMADFIAARVPALPKKPELFYSSDMTTQERANVEKQLLEYNAKVESHQMVKALARRWKTRSAVSAAIDMLKGFDEIFITDKDLDAHPNLLNVRNGVIDLETGRLHPHAPELYLTRQAPIIYNPRCRPVRFQKFLEEILPDVDTRAAVMRFLGYALTGEIREHAALFVKGSGANGKGTLFHLLLKILGDFATTMRFETFALRPVPRDADAPTPEFAKLVRRRLALIDELPENFRLDPATFKNTTGGDPIPYRHLHHDSSINRNPTHKLIFCGNFLPDLRNASDPGLERRLRVVDFPVQFLGEKADKTLEATLSSEQEITGALTLLVEQARLYYREGLLESTAMKEEKLDYLAQNDWLKDFVAENCVLGADESCTRSEMLARLAEFKPARGLSERSLTNMLKKIDGVNYGRKPHSGIMYFTGIGLTSTPESA